MEGTSFGNQQWYRVKQVKNRLHPDRNGTFILMTVLPGTSALRFHMEQPGNEHFCLQLASQVFELDTINNALVFFPDGQPALITESFSQSQEFMDLESLYKRQNQRKPVSTYLQVAAIIDSVCAANVIAKERFFMQVLYAWLIANAGAYAKNFGVVKTARGDSTIAPVFTAMCTRLHEFGPELALPGGLFDGDKNTPEFRENGNYSRNEFAAFGKRMGLMPDRIEKILDRFAGRKEMAVELIDRAFLPDEAKAIVRFTISERLMRLR
jgi:serine/threonine-protein kinase HipA